MIVECKDGLTVRELKDILKDWPETGRDGEPTEVWLLDGDGHSNVAIAAGPLSPNDLFLQHGVQSRLGYFIEGDN